MKYRHYFLVLTLIMTVLGSSCSFQKLLKSDDYEAKYMMAQQYYEQKDYSHALQLMDQIMPLFKGTDKAQKLAYMYAKSYFEQNDYVLASYYFKRYYKNYPQTEEASNALFYSAYCNYLDSPRASLDQSTTHTAIEEMELFIRRYPNSAKVKEAQAILVELNDKLEKKDFDIAYQYFRMEKYTAATTALKSFLKKYPTTNYREQAMYYILAASYQYAKESLAQKQVDRYLKTMEHYVDFIALFPESNFRSQADAINTKASTAIGRDITQ